MSDDVFGVLLLHIHTYGHIASEKYTAGYTWAQRMNNFVLSFDNYDVVPSVYLKYMAYNCIQISDYNLEW